MEAGSALPQYKTASKTWYRYIGGTETSLLYNA